MKKLLPLLVLIGACAPDIAQDGAPPDAIVVQFDPSHTEEIDGKKYPAPIVPLPNDLAKSAETGKLVVSSLPTDTDAQKEFNEKYLSTLNGFPFESTASVRFSGNLKVETVNAKNVIVVDITNPAAPAPVAGLTPVFVPANPDAKKDATISIAAPQGGWTRAHRYVIALVGGPDGLRGEGGQDVIGSSTWALVSGPNELITCTDPAVLGTCKLNVDIIPSDIHDDQQARLDDQKKKALQLEQLRKGYGQIVAGLQVAGINNVATLWTFSILDGGEMTFDPSNRVIPFPNDVLRDPSTGNVKLPNPKTGAALTAADCTGATDSQIQLTCGLNTLDGFSTLASPVTENSDKLGAAAQATVAAASLSTTTVGLVPLKSDAPKELRTKPAYTPCLNCRSSKDANGNPQTSPQQLQFSMDAPLDEKTTYAAYVTTDVKDDQGKSVVANPVFALVRSFAPLVVNGKSAVSIITDEQANALEPLRLAYKPVFDALDTLSVRRENLALAWPFTTLSVTTILAQLAAAPSAAAGLPDYPLGLQKVTGAFKGAAATLGITDLTAVADIYAGAMVSPVLVTGPGGTLNPSSPVVLPVKFTVTVPTGTPPANGWPVVVYDHGFTNWRNDFLYAANELSKKGFMVIAADALFHGDRASCTGSKAADPAITSDDLVCADPATMKCDGGTPVGVCVLKSDVGRLACTPGATGNVTCLTAGQGICAADSKCQGFNAVASPQFAVRPNTGPIGYGNSLISGWNALSPTNFFATRDNMRQQVVDLAQLVRVVKGADPAKSFFLQLAGANGAVPVPFDKSNMHFIGHSLGGIAGSLFSAVSPDMRNVALNASGGAWTTLLFNSDRYAALRDALIATLEAQGVKRGTPAFDQFIGVAQWVLDQADPANVALRNRTPVEVAAGSPTAPPAGRKVLLQFIEGDAAVSNLGSLAYVRAGNRSFVPVPPQYGCADPFFCYQFTEKGDNFDSTTAALPSRHRFLLNAPTGSAGAAITAKAQTQLSSFLATGTFTP